jgi:hypothetical protein
MTPQRYLEGYYQATRQRAWGHQPEFPTIGTTAPWSDDPHGEEITDRIVGLPTVASLFGGVYEIHDGGKYLYLTHVCEIGDRVLHVIPKQQLDALSEVRT